MKNAHYLSSIFLAGFACEPLTMKLEDGMRTIYVGLVVSLFFVQVIPVYAGSAAPTYNPALGEISNKTNPSPGNSATSGYNQVFQGYNDTLKGLTAPQQAYPNNVGNNVGNNTSPSVNEMVKEPVASTLQDTPIPTPTNTNCHPTMFDPC